MNEILSKDALTFLTTLHRLYNKRRLEHLTRRHDRQKQFAAGIYCDFLPETAHIRNDPSWKVAEAPRDLQQRYVEITGPVDKKMMINALNSGADVFMADFEDALSPTWSNVIQGQLNLIDAVNKTLAFTAGDGRQYSLHDTIATLAVRPRGWHLEESHLCIDGEPISASIFDFGLCFFHTVHQLLKNGSAPYFYLPKLESHLEARLWNDLFTTAQKELGIKAGTIRATVLIETLPAAFEMEEILYELREHISGLNAGRWDYIFSVIKTYHHKPGFTLPDRHQITMTVPFMRAYTKLLVRTCHKRGAHAIGGMAAYIPSRKDPQVNEIALQKVTEDKIREVTDGFDGTWVAHPDLVPIAKKVFQEHLKGPHQKERLNSDVKVTCNDLLDFRIPDAAVTEKGVRQNISVCLHYLQSWLQGVAAVAISNLMEDAATAEIARAELWQWLHQSTIQLEDGSLFNDKKFRSLTDDEFEKISSQHTQESFAKTKFTLARQILDDLVLNRDFAEFLTLKAYQYL